MADLSCNLVKSSDHGRTVDTAIHEPTPSRPDFGIQGEPWTWVDGLLADVKRLGQYALAGACVALIGGLVGGILTGALQRFVGSLFA